MPYLRRVVEAVRAGFCAGAPRQGRRWMVLAATGVLLVGVPCLAQAREASASREPIHMSPDSNTKAYALAQRLYARFLSAHVDTRVQTGVVLLGPTATGSVVVRFESHLTCNRDGCLTTVLKYNGAQRRWKEVFSHHTQSLMTGGLSPMKTGQGNKELITSDGLAWRWTSLGHYIPVPSSIGTPFPKFHSATELEVKTVLKGYPDLRPQEKERYAFKVSEPVLNGSTPDYFVVVEAGSLCGQSGCPFVLMAGAPSRGFNIETRGIFAQDAVILPRKHDGRNDIAVQMGDDLAYYSYDKQAYHIIKTTFPSKATPVP